MSRSGNNNRRGGNPARRSTAPRRHHPSQTVSVQDENTISIGVDNDVNLLHLTGHFQHASPTDKIGEVTPLWVYNAKGALVQPLYTQETEEAVGSKVRVIDISIPIAGGKENRATKLTPLITLYVNKETGECEIDEGENLPRGIMGIHGWKVVLKVDRIAGGRRAVA